MCKTNFYSTNKLFHTLFILITRKQLNTFNTFISPSDYMSLNFMRYKAHAFIKKKTLNIFFVSYHILFRLRLKSLRILRVDFIKKFVEL